MNIPFTPPALGAQMFSFPFYPQGLVGTPNTPFGAHFHTPLSKSFTENNLDGDEPDSPTQQLRRNRSETPLASGSAIDLAQLFPKPKTNEIKNEKITTREVSQSIS